ncbi:hypothetical protein BKA63DRAFT_570255 [Paraphoma chrysanthemicola]|nr:hypothetical protein BKA63DRAFT_570255 [Paraphoma chrysanthemicola]
MNPVLDSGAFVNPFTRFPGLFKSVSASVKVEPLSGKGPGVVGSTTRWKQYAASRSGESKESALRRVKRDAGLGRRTLRVRFAEPIVASEHPAQNGSGTDKDAGVDRRTRRVKSTKPASVWEDPTQNGGVTEAGVDRSARRARFPEPSVVVESLTQNAGVAENDAASDKNPRHVKLAKTAIVSEDTAQDGGITDPRIQGYRQMSTLPVNTGQSPQRQPNQARGHCQSLIPALPSRASRSQLAQGHRKPARGPGLPSTPKGSRATQSPPNDARAEPNLFTDFDPRSTIQLNMDTIQAARTLAPGTSASARLIEILEADNERMMKQYLDHVEQFNRTAALRQRPDSNCNTPIDQHRQCRQCGKSITGSDAVCECYGLDDPYDAADEAENKKQEQQQRRNEERKRELVKLLKMTQMKAPGGDGAKKE